jgi:hypothetical protein
MMGTIQIDVPKVKRMVVDTLMMFNDTGAHPAEVVLALAECIGRVIVTLPESDIAKQELTQLAVKHMAQAIEERLPKVITQ